MKKETQYTTLRERSGKCTVTMKMLFSGFRSTLTKRLKPLKDFLTGKELDFSKDSQNGLWISKRTAKHEAKKKMADLGGSWGVVKIGDNYCEVERSYFKVHNVKPEWVRRRDRKWLIRRK